MISRLITFLSFLLSVFVITNHSLFAFESSVDASDVVSEIASTQSPVFVKNIGQWPDSILFRADANGAILWFTSNSVYRQFFNETQKTDDDQENKTIETMLTRTALVGMNAHSKVEATQELSYYWNYFKGNDQSKWRTHIPCYASITFKNVYDGIDLCYYGKGGQIEYDFIVAPGIDPSVIGIQYDGIESLSSNEKKDLVIGTKWGQAIEQAPIVYSVGDRSSSRVAAEFVITENRTFHFALTDIYDQSKPLIIDPTLIFSTFLGGTSGDYGYEIAVNDSGEVAVIGITESVDFPMVNQYQTAIADLDVVITKLSADGQSALFSSYLGGHNNDDAHGVVFGIDGSLFVNGSTWATDFPVVLPFQTYQGANDIFVMKFTPSCDSVVFSTYLGGSSYEGGYGGIDVDTFGNVYLCGRTSSTNFPLVNPLQTGPPGTNGFVCKLAADGQSPVYSTYLGGSDYDVPDGIAVDAGGHAYVAGFTMSNDFPVMNTLYPKQAGSDAFVVKFSPDGGSLVYGTLLGGSDRDEITGMDIDSSGCAYVTGSTLSNDFPTKNPYQGNQSSMDAFVTKISPDGDSVVYSTYLTGGRAGSESGDDIAVTPDGNAFVIGTNGDAFIAELSLSGDSLVFGVNLGGGSSEFGKDIAVDNSGNAYVVGETTSDTYPTKVPYQSLRAGATDFLVAKLSGAPFSCCFNIRSDVNGNGYITVQDLIFLVAYLFNSGTTPSCIDEANVNGVDAITVADLTYLIGYLFNNGAQPARCPIL